MSPDTPATPDRPKRFRKRPVVIEAMQYHAGTCALIHAWAGLREVGGHAPDCCGIEPIVIPTLEGDHYASPGDWIIKGIKGELYPCKPDIFEATYEPA
jgi:hypothetical protein